MNDDEVTCWTATPGARDRHVVNPARLGRFRDPLRRRLVTYEVQAHILNADDLAPASSNVVTVTRSLA